MIEVELFEHVEDLGLSLHILLFFYLLFLQLYLSASDDLILILQTARDRIQLLLVQSHLYCANIAFN